MDSQRTEGGGQRAEVLSAAQYFLTKARRGRDNASALCLLSSVFCYG